MDWLQPLAGGDKVTSWLQGCTAPRPPALMTIDWEGAPKNRKMNAVTIPRFGGASVLRNEVVDLPYELEECEVLIEVHACGINHLDCQLRAGELDTDHDIRLPCVPGADLSGKVRKIGDKVLNVKVGDAVFGRQSLARIVQGRGGACAEWCVVNAANVVSKPLSLSHELAAAVPTAGMVAFAALRLGKLEEVSQGGENVPQVAILGGSGGVGTFAIQIAKRHYGAFVLVCCSGEHAALVKQLGADAVIEYTQGDWKGQCSKHQNFDLVLDCVGLDVYWETFGRGVLGKHGKYVSLNSLQAAPSHNNSSAKSGAKTKRSAQNGEAPAAEDEDMGGLFDKTLGREMLKAKSRMLTMNSFFSGFRLFSSDLDLEPDDLEAVADLIQDGAVKVVVDSVHELRDVGLAHQRVESLNVGGKVVVRVRRPWERESVENFKLNVERANRVVSHDQEERPQDATVPTPPHSPMEGGGGVPSCSLGRDIIDKVHLANTIAQRLKTEPAKRTRPDRSNAGDDGGTGLPAGWEFAHDEEGTIYYYSHALGISQYEHPATGSCALPSREEQQLEKMVMESPQDALTTASEFQRVAARGSRSSGFMDDLLPPQSGILPAPDEAFSSGEEEEEVRVGNARGHMKAVPHRGRGLSTVGEEEDVGGSSWGLLSPSARTIRRQGTDRIGPLAEKIAEGIRGRVDSCTGVQCGLGVTLKLSSDGQYYVKKMELGGPCERSEQVQAGDVLLAVDGLAVSGLEYADLAQLVLGEEGSTVTLALVDVCGKQKEVTLRRFPIDPQALEDNERQLKLRTAKANAAKLAAVELALKQQEGGVSGGERRVRGGEEDEAEWGRCTQDLTADMQRAIASAKETERIMELEQQAERERRLRLQQEQEANEAKAQRNALMRTLEQQQQQLQDLQHRRVATSAETGQAIASAAPNVLYAASGHADHAFEQWAATQQPLPPSKSPLSHGALPPGGILESPFSRGAMVGALQGDASTTYSPLMEATPERNEALVGSSDCADGRFFKVQGGLVLHPTPPAHHQRHPAPVGPCPTQKTSFQHQQTARTSSSHSSHNSHGFDPEQYAGSTSSVRSQSCHSSHSSHSDRGGVQVGGSGGFLPAGLAVLESTERGRGLRAGARGTSMFEVDTTADLKAQQEMFERLHPHNLSVATPTSHATATTTAQTTTPAQRQVGAQKVVYAADKAAPAAVLKGKGAARLTSMFELDEATKQLLLNAQESGGESEGRGETVYDSVTVSHDRISSCQNPSNPSTHSDGISRSGGGSADAGAGGLRETDAETAKKKKRQAAARLTTMFDVDANLYGKSVAMQVEQAAAADPRMDAFLAAHGNIPLAQ